MKTMLPVAMLSCVLGCSDARLPPEIDAFRSSLADPAKYPVRRGDDIEPSRIVLAVAEFARTNREILDAHFRKTLTRIPDGTVPTEPGYSQVHGISPELLAQAGESVRSQWALFPDAEGVTNTANLMLLPAMLREAGFERQRISLWLAFFATAKPTLTKVVHADDRVSLISDYGNADVLVVTLSRRDVGWSATGYSWWRPIGGS